MMRSRCYVLCVVALLLNGCAGWKPATGQRHIDSSHGYSFATPSDWYQVPNSVVAFDAAFTRDGTPLQVLGVNFQNHRQVFDHIGVLSSTRLLPHELAEHFVAELMTEMSLDTLKVLESRPVSVAGRLGVDLVLEYRVPTGLRYRWRLALVSTKEGVLSIQLLTPALHFFERHQADFEAVLSSVSIVE